MSQIRIENFPLEDVTEEVIGLGIQIHKNLGPGFLEIVYKDALEYELQKQIIYYTREKEFVIKYKDIILPHKFYADFVILDQIILEIKSKNSIADIDYAQTINYLKCSNLKVGLILNFGQTRLQIKRVVY